MSITATLDAIEKRAEAATGIHATYFVRKDVPKLVAALRHVLEYVPYTAQVTVERILASQGAGSGGEG